MKRHLLVVAALVVAAMMPLAYGQAQLISGTVVDPTGAVVPGAAVKIFDEAKQNLVREVVSDDEGRFQALNINPGVYTVTIELTGFKKTELKGVKLDVNTKLDIGSVKMEVGEVGTTLSVTSEMPQVQVNTMEKAFLVEAKQLTELPMNGRNWTALVGTVPGVASTARTNFDLSFNDVSQMHVAGGRGTQNNFYLDGAPNLDVGDAQSQYTQPSIDSVAEFKVQMSAFNAEFGRNSGMVVAVQTKSGGSDFHGTLYEFARNDYFDAVKPNRLRTDDPNDREKDVLRYHQFGGNISGWIPFPGVSNKDNKRLFFFYNREMTRRISSAGQGSSVDIAGPEMLNGDFSKILGTADMEHAPGFKTGTVFQPGTITRDGNGNITGGTPFPGNIVPKTQWNSSSAAFLKFFEGLSPVQAIPGNPGYQRYFYTSPYEFKKDQDILRVDYVINDSSTAYFRWVNDNQRERNPGAIWGWQPFPMMPQRRPKPGSSWSMNIIKSFTPNISTETVLAYLHQSQELAPVDVEGSQASAMGINIPQLSPSTNRYGVPPNFQAEGTANGAPGTNVFSLWGNPGWHNDGKDYSLTQNLSWYKNNHSFKFGFHYVRDNKKQTATWPLAPTMVFNPSSTMGSQDTGMGLANMMLGLYQSYSQNNVHVYPYFRFQSWEGFAQDSWKMSPHFTMEYGVRFQRSTPTYTYKRTDGKPGEEGTFDSWSVDLRKYDRSKAPVININTGAFDSDPLNALLAVGLVNDTMPGVPRGFADTLNLFAPRVGFAYDLTGDGKTALRAGAGVFYERLRQNNFNFGAGGFYPSSTNLTAGPGNVADIVANPAGSVRPVGYAMFPADNLMPAIYSWSLGIQRQLSNGFALDVSYMGNNAIHLMIQRNANGLPTGYFTANPNARASVNGFDDALRPYYGFGNLNSIETTGIAQYHGLLTRLSRRFSNGFSMNVSYTWSRAMGENDNDTNQINNPFDRHQDWAPLSHDRTHVFIFDYIYELPKLGAKYDMNPVVKAILDGWQVSGITEFSSGLPVTITSNGDLHGLNLGSQRAVLIGDPEAGRNKNQWFNPAAFGRPADDQWGLGRNAFRLPGVNNWDVTLQKTFKMAEAVGLNVRVDMYNFFNHGQIWGVRTGFAADAPGQGIRDSDRQTFGTPNEYRDPRILQLAMKLTF